MLFAASRALMTPTAFILGGPSWLTFLGRTKDSLWSCDLFRCESATLRTYWVLVVIGTVDVNTSTDLYSGRQPISRRSYSIFNITITAIERMPDWTDACPEPGVNGPRR